MTIAPPDPASVSGSAGRDLSAPAPAPAGWPHIARELADDLATDAVEREQAAKPPHDEVARLRESGLLTLLVPAAHGGGGADWRTAYAVVRTVSAADGAIGRLLGNHYFLSSTARFFGGPERAARIERASAAGQWCWGGGIASQEPPLMLTPTAHGYLLDGHQRYDTGVGVADRLLVRAAVPGTGEPVAVLADPAHPGVLGAGAGDTFGQRLAAGGGVGFDGVPVAADDVLGSLSADDGALSPFAGLSAPPAWSPPTSVSASQRGCSAKSGSTDGSYGPPGSRSPRSPGRAARPRTRTRSPRTASSRSPRGRRPPSPTRPWTP